MNENHRIAGKALKMMFLGQVLAIGGAVLLIVPIIGILGGLIALAGGIMALVGLFQARPAHELYQKAVIMLGIGIALSLLGGVLPGFLSTLASVAVNVVNFFQFYYVCNATSLLLREAGNEPTAAKGDQAWKITGVAMAVGAVVTLISALIPIFAPVLAIVNLLASIAANIFYIIFLKESSESLSA